MLFNRINQMKIYVFIVLVICVAPCLSGQAETKLNEYKIIRSNTGLGGSSKVFHTSKGRYVVSQSIGQSSIIGTASNNGYYLRQGYQQPHKRIKIIKTTIDDLKAVVYPNPFNYTVQISFRESISKNIDIEIYGFQRARHQFYDLLKMCCPALFRWLHFSFLF